MPLLGVCLGHQGIGHISGAEVVHAPEVMHGRMSAVYHDDSPLFADIPQGFTVVRYHSLCITEPLPEDLEAIAWTADGIVMGAAHRKRPVWGVQFHPESICTDWGRRLLANFRDMTAGVAGGRRTPLTQPATNGGGTKWSPPQRPRLRLQVERIDRLYDAEQVFVQSLRRPQLRLLARQQQGRRALALLVHGRERRPAQLGGDLGRDHRQS